MVLSADAYTVHTCRVQLVQPNASRNLLKHQVINQSQPTRLHVVDSFQESSRVCEVIDTTWYLIPINVLRDVGLTGTFADNKSYALSDNCY